MQVSQKDTHLTHAIINAGESISFGVSEDPMFFKMLYSSLYSDPRRAAFREPLCNAWDANIDNGMENTPLQITITEESVTFKDSGKGIPHDRIREVYLTLGKSTKVEDSAQTGGFGLGCKAPFAYADHFEVRSHCDGICTIYRMLKVDPANNGKPGASVIAQFPTTETGLTVTIPFVIHGHDRSGKPISNDKSTVTDRIMKDISQGGILAQVNGVDVPTLPLKREPGSWVIMTASDAGLESGIHVRYGSVIYPVHSFSGNVPNASTIHNLLYRAFRSSNVAIIFQAPADSIVIPPSRESISQHQVTYDTLNSLLGAFMEAVSQKVNGLSDKLYQEAIKKYKEDTNLTRWDHISAVSLNKLCRATDCIDEDGDIRPGAYLDDPVLVNRADLLYRGVIGNSRNQETDLDYTKLNKLVQTKHITKKAAKQIRKVIRYVHKSGRYYTGRDLVTRTALVPLAAKIVKAGGKLANLYQVDHSSYNMRYAFNDWDKASIQDVCDLAAYYRNIVILGYSKSDVWEMHRDSESILARKNGGTNGVMAYICPRQKGLGAKMRKHLSKYKEITLIDLTEKRDIEQAEAEADRREAARKLAEAKKAGLPVPEKPKPVKLPGFASLANANNGKLHCNFDFGSLKSTSLWRVEKPRFWVQLPEFARRGSKYYAFDLPEDRTDFTKYLLGPFAEQGIAVLNKEYGKHIEKSGIPEFKEFLVAYIERALGSCKQQGRSQGLRVMQVMRDMGLKPAHHMQVVNAYKHIASCHWLATYYGVRDVGPSVHVLKDIELLDQTINSKLLDNHPDLLERVAEVKRDLYKPIISKAAKKLINKLLKINGLEFINTQRACEVSSDFSKQLSERRIARKFITNLIKK